MATIKSYTDFSQSKALNKILLLESADMLHCLSFDGDLLATVPKQYSGSFRHQPELTTPCWSFAALLNVLPKIINNETLFIETSAALWHIGYRNIYTTRADNPVDACYEMIIRLHELKMLRL